MKNNKILLPVILVAVLFVALLTCLLVRVWLPAAIIPTLNIPNMVLLSVVALLIEHFLAQGNPRCYDTEERQYVCHHCSRRIPGLTQEP